MTGKYFLDTNNWDSLIVSAAKSARCHTIITEDLNPGGMLAGIQIKNPFF